MLLRGANGPIERSNAITSIVKSISVIDDQIVRATYIKECAQRIGIAEQTLINEMNKLIRGEREQKARQDEREVNRLLAQNTTPQVSNTPPATVIGTSRHDQQTAKLERYIIQLVVKHGAEVILHDVENDDGTTSNLTVAEFIYYDLHDDGLRLNDPTCNAILEEAVSRIQAGNTQLAEHFMHHHDLKVSSLAAVLGTEEYQLTDSLKLKEDEEYLKNQTIRLLLEYRMVIVRTQLDEYKRQLAVSTDDEEKTRILGDITSLTAMRTEIAKRLGNSIII